MSPEPLNRDHVSDSQGGKQLVRRRGATPQDERLEWRTELIRALTTIHTSTMRKEFTLREDEDRGRERITLMALSDRRDCPLSPLGPMNTSDPGIPSYRSPCRPRARAMPT